MLPHFQYCSPHLLEILRTLNNKFEYANYYALRTIILNLGRLVSYDVCLSITSMRSLEQRRIQQSLIVFFLRFRMQGPSYISNFSVIPRVTNYCLLGRGINVLKPCYNNHLGTTRFLIL